MPNLRVALKPATPRVRRGHPLARGLVCGYFMHARADTVLDIVSNRHLTMLDPSQTSVAQSQEGRALWFASGSDSGDRAQAGATGILTPTDDFALVARFRPDDVATQRRIVFGVGDDDSDGYAIASSGDTAGDVGGVYGGVGWLSPGGSYTQGEWYTIALMRAGGTTRFMINGRLLSWTSAGSPDAPSDNVYFGATSNSSHIGPISMGLFYNRALTPNEARMLHIDPYALIRHHNTASGLATVISVSVVSLSWDDNSDGEASGFSIERSTTSATEGFSEIDTVPVETTSYDDTDLDPGTYWYRLRSYDAGGQYSDYSQAAEVTVT